MSIICLSTDNSERAFYKELVKVIEASDVILEVVDARDPLGTRCVDMERMVMKSGADKRLVLLLNKIGNGSALPFLFVALLDVLTSYDTSMVLFFFGGGWVSGLLSIQSLRDDF